MKSLKEIQKEYNFKTDKETVHTYLKVYDKLFKPFQNKKIKLLEIGILFGESLKLWSKYFEQGEIWGIDIFAIYNFGIVVSNLLGYDIVELHKVDSVNDIGKESRDKFIKDSPMFDIIIDDGHHNSKSQVKTFNNFIDKLNNGGIYIIEDIKEWDGHLKYVIEQIPQIDIINMNDQPRTFSDNILGIYKK